MLNKIELKTTKMAEDEISKLKQDLTNLQGE